MEKTGGLNALLFFTLSKKGNVMAYNGQTIQLDPAVNREGLESLYPSGVIPGEDVSSILKTMINVAYDAINNITENFKSQGGVFAINVALLEPVIEREFDELKMSPIARDITFNEFEEISEQTADYLMMFADFLYAPSQTDADWFKYFYNKHFTHQ